MIKALLALAVLVASQAARAATAYEALQTLGKLKGETLLDNVTEVRGEKGVPEPRTWKIAVKNAGRAGGKEYSVQGKQITAERAARADGAPMNMNQLSLDSDGAHTVAERQAKKAAFAYDHANYTLRAGSKSGSPIWEVRLTDEQSGNTATVNVAATTGNVLSTDGLTNRRKAVAGAPAPLPAPAPEPAPYVTPAPAPRYQPAPEDRSAQPSSGRYSPGFQRANDDANQFFDRVGNHMERRGHQIGDFFHNLFTGDRRHTAGPHGSRPEPDYAPAPAPARKGDEDYVRPSRVRD